MPTTVFGMGNWKVEENPRIPSPAFPRLGDFFFFFTFLFLFFCSFLFLILLSLLHSAVDILHTIA